MQGLSMGTDNPALLFILGRVSNVSPGTFVITETISRSSQVQILLLAERTGWPVVQVRVVTYGNRELSIL